MNAEELADEIIRVMANVYTEEWQRKEVRKLIRDWAFSLEKLNSEVEL